MSEIDETAKAVQEIAKLGQSTVENLDGVERIGRKLLGPFGQAYGILTDIVAYKRDEIRWRLANKMAIYHLAKNKIDQSQISDSEIFPVPPRIAFDYEEALEREDDASLQDIWAQLLVNVTTNISDAKPKKAYKDILSRLDADLAAVFQEIAKRANIIRVYFTVAGTGDGGIAIAGIRYSVETFQIESSPLFQFEHEAGNDRFYCPIEEDRFESIIDSLASIGIVSWEYELIQAKELLEIAENLDPSENLLELGKKVLESAEAIKVFSISALGREFWNAIRPPSAGL